MTYLFEASPAYLFKAANDHGCPQPGTDTSSVSVGLSWSSGHPICVLMSIDDGAPHPPPWRVGRTLLARGLVSTEWVGDGSVRLRAPGAFVTMHFRPPGQVPVHLVMNRKPFDRLVVDAELEVPDGGPLECTLVEGALVRELEAWGLA